MDTIKITRHSLNHFPHQVHPLPGNQRYTIVILHVKKIVLPFPSTILKYNSLMQFVQFLDMNQPDFRGLATFVSIISTKPTTTNS
jgi:hypothetical protein